MEEMQKAFNKTIIKLQNTSRIAEEQVSSKTGLRHETQVPLETLETRVSWGNVSVEPCKSWRC